MKVLLFGANGQVGHALRSALAPIGDVVATTRSGALDDGVACETADFDRPDTLAEIVARIAPVAVVNAAAYTAVDRAESDRDAAFRANAEAPAALAAACARAGIPLIHYSTDYVFDGTATRPYREDDATAPLGVYGASKLAGEDAIRASGAQHAILRTAWVYAAHGKNFMRTMLRLAAEREELRVVADQVGSPTTADWIAAATVPVLRAMLDAPERSVGVRHLTAAGETTWHGFATAIVDAAHARGLIARKPTVVPIATVDYPTPARRPGYSVLDNGCLSAELGIPWPHWAEDLNRALASIARTVA
ncbi:MAG: dTDP-4-dehydrorhamnose reductase [Lysobacter sp.]|nr:dTDP-4-dehydrorhamnose reductase [Lysobacter sp.]